MDFQTERFCQVSPYVAARDIKRRRERPQCQNLSGEVEGVMPRVNPEALGRRKWLA